MNANYKRESQALVWEGSDLRKHSRQLVTESRKVRDKSQELRRLSLAARFQEAFTRSSDEQRKSALPSFSS
jgi:hypothetical protein